ncbi:MAG: ATP synthase subunit I [Burkholderiales bacterium]
MPHRSKLTLIALEGYTTPALLGAEINIAMLRNLSRPIRTVLRWQLIATAALALIAGALAGGHGALSAALGGAVSISSGLASAVVASLGRANSAEGALFAVLRAEAVKIGLIVILLWLVLATYRDVAVLVFLGAFAVTMVIFAMAFFVREY